MENAASDKKVNQNVNSRTKGGHNSDRPIMISEIERLVSTLVNLNEYLKADGSIPMTGLLTLSGDAISSLNPITLTQFNSVLSATVNNIINGAPSDLDSLGELAAAVNNDPNFSTTITNELNNIKNYEFKILYYEEINTSTGTITKPSNTDIILSDFPSGYDAVVETIVSGKPSGEISRTSGNVPITVTSFDINGNYTLSDTPSSTPIAFLYVLKVKAQYLSNLTFNNIIEAQNVSSSQASNITFVPNGDIISTDVQNAIVEVRDDTDIKLSNKQPLDSDLTTIAAINSGTGSGVIASDGAGWIYKTYSTLKTALGLTKSDVGLSNVDNTSDINKPVSTAQAAANSAILTAAESYADGKVIDSIANSDSTHAPSRNSVFDALALKEDVIATGTIFQYWRGDKSFQTLDKTAVGLGNVDNTSDVNKPVSTAQQSALNLKEDLTNKATDLSSNDNTHYPTTAAVQTAINTAVTGLLNYRGQYNASTNLFPSTGGSGLAGIVLKGDFWICSIAGTLGGTSVSSGDLIIALVNTPAQTAANWDLIQHELGFTIVPINSGGTNSTSQVTNGVNYFDGTSIKSLATFLFDGSKLGIGATPDSELTVSKQTTIMSPPTGTLIHFIGLDSNSLRLALDTFNSALGGTAFLGRHAYGTAGSPSALQTGATIITVNGQGYGATGWPAASTGLITIKANQNFTDAAMGTYISISTTPDGSVTAVEAMRINGDKSITVANWKGDAIAVLYGGTGATTAAAARTNLGAISRGATRRFTHTSLTVAQNTSYFFGTASTTASTTTSINRRGGAPFTGFLISVDIDIIVATVLGTTEQATLKVNNITAGTSVTVTTTLQYNAAGQFYSITLGTPFAVTAADALEVQIVEPVTFATAPTGVQHVVDMVFAV